jgi:hypothetical protein
MRRDYESENKRFMAEAGCKPSADGKWIVDIETGEILLGGEMGRRWERRTGRKLTDPVTPIYR